MARSPESELASRFSLTTLFLATTQTTTGRSPKDDFSVLKDPTVMCPRLQARNHRIQNAAEQIKSQH
jgi:ATP-dependent phosphoenolpyruvate carboxykinase